MMISSDREGLIEMNGWMMMIERRLDGVEAEQKEQRAEIIAIHENLSVQNAKLEMLI